jgi:hypothetical protein
MLTCVGGVQPGQPQPLGEGLLAAVVGLDARLIPHLPLAGLVLGAPNLVLITKLWEAPG